MASNERYLRTIYAGISPHEFSTLPPLLYWMQYQSYDRIRMPPDSILPVPNETYRVHMPRRSRNELQM